MATIVNDKCVICFYGETKAGLVTVTSERDNSLVIVKQVPADVCGYCGEYYLMGSITEQV